MLDGPWACWRDLRIRGRRSASALCLSAKARDDRGISEPDYAKYYDLEGYLFGEVSARFRRDKHLSAFDFFCIVIWKANRSKSKVARRLLAPGYPDLESAVKALTSEVDAAIDSKQRLAVLIDGWRFRLPMASAILTVLYPDDFTVYDVRVCGVLGDFADAQSKKFAELWPHYQEYIERVRNEVPGQASLRDKDRFLWGKSFESQLKTDIENGFGTGVDDSELEA